MKRFLAAVAVAASFTLAVSAPAEAKPSKPPKATLPAQIATVNTAANAITLASGATVVYDANDVYAITECGATRSATLTEFEAVLASGQTLSGSVAGNPKGSSSLTTDIGCPPPTSTAPVVTRSYAYDGSSPQNTDYTPPNGVFDKPVGTTGDIVYLHFDQEVVVASDATATFVGADGSSVTVPVYAYPHDTSIVYAQPEPGATVQPSYPLTLNSITGVTNAQNEEPDLASSDTAIEVAQQA